MTDFLFGYVTTATRSEAEKIGRALVDRELAACVNFWEGMESIYRWKSKIETARETVLIVKTREALREDVIAAVKELHSYEVPCVVFLRVEGGNSDYLNWLGENSKG